MLWKIGSKILYHGVKEATLIKPMTPYGIRNSETKTEGQVWELKFDDLPCTVYRWLYPALDLEAKP
jgi:hypothetical protein